MADLPDLSDLSDADLKAVASGDMSKVSDEGLRIIAAEPQIKNAGGSLKAEGKEPRPGSGGQMPLDVAEAMKAKVSRDPLTGEMHGPRIEPTSAELTKEEKAKKLVASKYAGVSAPVGREATGALDVAGRTLAAGAHAAVTAPGNSLMRMAGRDPNTGGSLPSNEFTVGGTVNRIGSGLAAAFEVTPYGIAYSGTGGAKEQAEKEMPEMGDVGPPRILGRRIIDYADVPATVMQGTAKLGGMAGRAASELIDPTQAYNPGQTGLEVAGQEIGGLAPLALMGNEGLNRDVSIKKLIADLGTAVSKKSTKIDLNDPSAMKRGMTNDTLNQRREWQKETDTSWKDIPPPAAERGMPARSTPVDAGIQPMYQNDPWHRIEARPQGVPDPAYPNAEPLSGPAYTPEFPPDSPFYQEPAATQGEALGTDTTFPSAVEKLIRDLSGAKDEEGEAAPGEKSDLGMKTKEKAEVTKPADKSKAKASLYDEMVPDEATMTPEELAAAGEGVWEGQEPPKAENAPEASPERQAAAEAELRRLTQQKETENVAKAAEAQRMIDTLSERYPEVAKKVQPELGDQAARSGAKPTKTPKTKKPAALAPEPEPAVETPQTPLDTAARAVVEFGLDNPSAEAGILEAEMKQRGETASPEQINEALQKARAPRPRQGGAMGRRGGKQSGQVYVPTSAEIASKVAEFSKKIAEGADEFGRRWVLRPPYFKVLREVSAAYPEEWKHYQATNQLHFPDKHGPFKATPEAVRWLITSMDEMGARSAEKYGEQAHSSVEAEGLRHDVEHTFPDSDMVGMRQLGPNGELMSTKRQVDPGALEHIAEVELRSRENAARHDEFARTMREFNQMQATPFGKKFVPFSEQVPDTLSDLDVKPRRPSQGGSMGRRGGKQSGELRVPSAGEVGEAVVEGTKAVGGALASVVKDTASKIHDLAEDPRFVTAGEIAQNAVKDYAASLHEKDNRRNQIQGEHLIPMREAYEELSGADKKWVQQSADQYMRNEAPAPTVEAKNFMDEYWSRGVADPLVNRYQGAGGRFYDSQTGKSRESRVVGTDFFPTKFSKEGWEALTKGDPEAVAAWERDNPDKPNPTQVKMTDEGHWSGAASRPAYGSATFARGANVPRELSESNNWLAMQNYVREMSGAIADQETYQRRAETGGANGPGGLGKEGEYLDRIKQVVGETEAKKIYNEAVTAREGPGSPGFTEGDKTLATTSKVANEAAGVYYLAGNLSAAVKHLVTTGLIAGKSKAMSLLEGTLRSSVAGRSTFKEGRRAGAVPEMTDFRRTAGLWDTEPVKLGVGKALDLSRVALSGTFSMLHTVAYATSKPELARLQAEIQAGGHPAEIAMRTLGYDFKLPRETIDRISNGTETAQDVQFFRQQFVKLTTGRATSMERSALGNSSSPAIRALMFLKNTAVSVTNQVLRGPLHEAMQYDPLRPIETRASLYPLAKYALVSLMIEQGLTKVYDGVFGKSENDKKMKDVKDGKTALDWMAANMARGGVFGVFGEIGAGATREFTAPEGTHKHEVLRVLEMPAADLIKEFGQDYAKATSIAEAVASFLKQQPAVRQYRGFKKEHMNSALKERELQDLGVK